MQGAWVQSPARELGPHMVHITAKLFFLRYHWTRAQFPAPNRLVVVVQSPSHARLFATPWPAARQSSLSFTISWSLLKLVSSELVILSNHLILCHPLLLLPSVFPSIRTELILARATVYVLHVYVCIRLYVHIDNMEESDYIYVAIYINICSYTHVCFKI